MAAPIAKRIIVAARVGQVAELSDGDRDIWDFLIAMQWRRVPDMHETVVDDAKFEEMLAESVADYEREYGPLTEDDRRWASDPAKRPHLRHNITVASLRSRQDRVFQALRTRGLGVAVPARRGKSSFIIGSRPILRAGPSGETLLHPQIEGWLPLAPDVAVTPYGRLGETYFIELETAPVRHMNRHIAKQSSAIASPSMQLITSLTPAMLKS